MTQALLPYHRVQSCRPHDSPEAAYQPRAAWGVHPKRIILAKGSRATSEGRALAESVCSVYPDAEVLAQPTSPHNRIDLGSTDPLAMQCRGKQTLVLAEHRSALRRSTETGNTCPNFWHFSPYGFCPYDCQYCYLAGTQGIRFSPAVKIFTNVAEMLTQIDDVAARLGTPTAFYLGKLQDPLALDLLTGYSRTLIPFFASHPYARLVALTKCADVRNLLDLDHRGHTILSWSVNPPSVCREFEVNTPSPSQRIEAMRKCSAAGYPVRAVIMPIIPVPGWQRIYDEFLELLLAEVPLDRITLGCVCIYPTARRLMESRLGKQNTISQALENRPGRPADGRSRYPMRLRLALYRHFIDRIQQLRPDLRPALCLEDETIFEALDLTSSIGPCNCVL
jgi:spore photoproduct lyase